MSRWPPSDAVAAPTGASHEELREAHQFDVGARCVAGGEADGLVQVPLQNRARVGARLLNDPELVLDQYGVILVDGFPGQGIGVGVPLGTDALQGLGLPLTTACRQ